MPVSRTWGLVLRACVASIAASCLITGVVPIAEAVIAEPVVVQALPCPAGHIALTFDDGPVRVQTLRLLGILTQHHVPATFFMIGSRVAAVPALARRVAGAGYQIGNHTWSHPMLTRLSDDAIRYQLRRTTRAFRAAGLPIGPLMRPPYGDIDDRVRTVIRGLGLVPVLWTVDSRDWAGGGARQIADRILAQLRPHRRNIVLQHDGVTNSPNSIDAVPLVIRAARRRGYCFTGLDAAGRMAPLTAPTLARPAVLAAPVVARLSSPLAARPLPVGAFDPFLTLR